MKKKTNWTELGVIVGIGTLVVTVFFVIHNEQQKAASANAPKVANAKAHGYQGKHSGP